MRLRCSEALTEPECNSVNRPGAPRVGRSALGPFAYCEAPSSSQPSRVTSQACREVADWGLCWLACGPCSCTKHPAPGSRTPCLAWCQVRINGCTVLTCSQGARTHYAGATRTVALAAPWSSTWSWSWPACSGSKHYSCRSGWTLNVSV